MSRIYLAGVGWVDDDPAGNRLRWRYPVGDVRDLPRSIVVERAVVDDEVEQHDPAQSPPTAAAPARWWTGLGDVVPAGAGPPLELALPEPAQAVRFTFRGSDARVVVVDAGSRLPDRVVSDGERVELTGSSIDALHVLAFGGVTLEDVEVLDLFADHALEWTHVATLAVEPVLREAVEDALPRATVPVVVGPAEWDELTDLLAAARRDPDDPLAPGGPTTWEAAETVLGVRWHVALIAGFAFVDGPGAGASPHDELLDVLPGRPGALTAYRVRDRDGGADPSNVCLCPPQSTPPLRVPDPPVLREMNVRLRVADRFDATVSPAWRHRDARAIGVEVEEEVGSSPATGARAEIRRFESRPAAPPGGGGAGDTTRSFTLPFHDSPYRCRIRSVDGWDRVSAFSAWTPWRTFALDHEPAAPPLAAARIVAGQTVIERSVGVPDVPDWRPDAVVEAAAGRVLVYRRIAAPREATVVVASPVPLGDGRFRVTLSGSFDPAAFAGGFLVAGEARVGITALSPSEALFVVPEEAGATTLFSRGEARLLQRPTHDSLWRQVADFAAATLPEDLAFVDPVPLPPTGADVVSYCCRVSFLGRLGPASGAVQAVRTVAAPAVPPPFAVAPLGEDYYGRTLVRIRFTTPVDPRDTFSTWWGRGEMTAAQLEERGNRGELGDVSATDGRNLFDVMPLPIPVRIGERVTIGVQRTNAAGAESRLAALSLSLLPRA